MINYIKLILKLYKNDSLYLLPIFLKEQKKNKAIRANVNDVIILLTDHFEPPIKSHDGGVSHVSEWIRNYENVAQRFRDSDGKFPQHTWFYRSENQNDECLMLLNKSVYRGFGEIEFHLHHSYDTSKSFNDKIIKYLEWYNSFGAMIHPDCKLATKFAYIAGNWSLDNGAGDDSLSGVNNEIEILSNLGCYADFTFPAFASPAQPRIINSIYKAKDDGYRKSYDKGEIISSKKKLKAI